MNLETKLKHILPHLCDAITPAARWGVVWLIGKQKIADSLFFRALSEAQRWEYLNFTTDNRGLAALIGAEEGIMPRDMAEWVDTLAKTAETPVVIVDELEPLLALWNSHQQQQFARIVSKLPRHAAGVVIVVRWKAFSRLVISSVPNNAHLIDLNEDSP